MNTEHQPQQPPTRDPACCGTCAAIVSALTPEELVKAPGQGGDIFLKRGTPVEVERRKGEAVVRGRAEQIDGDLIKGDGGWVWLWMPRHAELGWSLWLVEDAPTPVDPDAELVERMAKEVHDRNCADVGCRDWDGHGESTRKAWRDDARVVIRNLRAQGFGVTPRAEQ